MNPDFPKTFTVLCRDIQKAKSSQVKYIAVQCSLYWKKCDTDAQSIMKGDPSHLTCKIYAH